MVTHYKMNRDSIKRIKEAFLDNGEDVGDEVRDEIIQSWTRCRERRLQRNASIPKNSVVEAVEPSYDMAFLRDYILNEVVAVLYEGLVLYKGALFYAYDDGIIFSQRGSKEMLQHLNSLNIGIGTCIKEEFLGTTGAAIIHESNSEAWVIGEEHYLEIFSELATHCFYSEDFNARTYTLIILPRENLTEKFLNLSKLFHKARKVTLQNYREHLELEMKSDLFEQLIPKEQAVVFVDSFGKIVYFNQEFSRCFKVSKEEAKNVDCVKIVPELERVLSCLNTGEAILFEELYLGKANGNGCFMRMVVKPMIHNNLISGLIIQLLNSKVVRQTVNKVANSQAYYNFDNIIGLSPAIQKVKKSAISISRSSSSVVITGESGTGKEVFAQAIHNNSLRKDGPFVAVNCVAIPQELIASELFGYVEGAFTGARKGGSMGKFEYAHKGTLFLDEIGELPMYAQTMLLRVLEERRVTRIASNISTPIDVRLITATHRDLKKMMKEGTFRADLYYRIKVIPLHLPPLRERITDIPLLLDYFVRQFNKTLGKNIKEVSPEAISYLIRYSWPGNLREFRNAVECAMNNATGDTLKLKDFPGDVFEYADDDNGAKMIPEVPQESNFKYEEKKRILRLLIEFSGNKSQVADIIGISRSTLYRKIKEYKLESGS
ncbi:conserved hypothetical protein [uncultured Sporomusa sp.]|uniref:Sigma-54 factor interaction domain-containing protein n=1 Tax=uncultured Sporomusa sp. TaxID=307249 RepID=A0A212LWT9_9FIRM|nr:sigma 54-interacting transcriptional regulator [uncultured Sporomusa sp.]SCM81917.1 conserved hypothetical protein [uncultured Sporomusa sp.]